MFLRNGLEPWHLIVVAVVVVLLFGSKKLPDSARALGKSLRILKSETRALRQSGGDTGSAEDEPASGRASGAAPGAAAHGAAPGTTPGTESGPASASAAGPAAPSPTPPSAA